MSTVKITNVSHVVPSMLDTMRPEVEAGKVEATASTITFHVDSAAALALVVAAINERTSGKGNPRAAMNTLRRKLEKLAAKPTADTADDLAAKRAEKDAGKAGDVLVAEREAAADTFVPMSVTELRTGTPDAGRQDSTTLTAVYGTDGTFHVHATGCSDIERTVTQGKANGSPMPVRTSTLTYDGVMRELWSDFLDEWDGDVSHGESATDFLPCAARLLGADEPEAVEGDGDEVATLSGDEREALWAAQRAAEAPAAPVAEPTERAVPEVVAEVVHRIRKGEKGKGAQQVAHAVPMTGGGRTVRDIGRLRHALYAAGEFAAGDSLRIDVTAAA